MISLSEVKISPTAPFIGSKLGSANKETVAGAIIMACQKEGQWKVETTAAEEILKKMPVYRHEPLQCLSAFYEMVSQKLFILAKNEQGKLCVEVTEKLINLLTQN